MRLGKPGLILIFALTCLGGMGQEAVLMLPGQYEIVSSDPLGNFYLVEEGQIQKIDSLGETLRTFSNPTLGEISWLDTSDPFRILVYYGSFNQMIYLDRTLSPLGEPVYLDELELFNPIGMCRASQGGFWLIDKGSNSLILLSSDLKRKIQTRLSGLQDWDQDTFSPMLEWKERLYICRKNIDIQQFDLFGTPLKSIPVKAKSICILERSILFIGDENISRYSDFPPALWTDNELIKYEYEELNISRNRAVLKDRNGWGLYRLKKTIQLPE